jgi:hypothetical protein
VPESTQSTFIRLSETLVEETLVEETLVELAANFCGDNEFATVSFGWPFNKQSPTCGI